MTVAAKHHQHVGRDEKCSECGQTEMVHEIRMMEDPDSWPAWPLLPLTRRVPDEEFECAFLVDQPGSEAKHLFKATIFEVKEVMADKTKQERFESFEDIYRAGYRVD